MKGILAVIVVFSILLSGCSSQLRNPEPISEVTLKVSAPLSTALIKIHQQSPEQAIIIYEATDRFEGINESDSKNISMQEFKELKELIVNNSFWSYKRNYLDENLMDGTAFEITVYYGMTMYSVRCYGECPEKITEIIDRIEELWGKEILQIGM